MPARRFQRPPDVTLGEPHPYESQLGKMLNGEAAVGPEQFFYLRNTNVHWDRFDLRDLAKMHFSPEDRARCELRNGDLLVCEGGEVGRSAVWPGERADVYFQKAIHRVRPLNRNHSPAQAAFGWGGIHGSPLKRRVRASMAGTSCLRVVER